MIIKKLLLHSKVWLYRFVFSKNRNIIGKPKCLQPTVFLGMGKIEIGNGNVFGYNPSPFFYSGSCHVEARADDAAIIFGDNNHFNNNFVVIAEHGKIEIGSDCLIGWNVSVCNSDFHPIRVAERHNASQRSKDVKIGNNVFIGSNVTILKGVSIGDNAVIASGSVVKDDVDENTIVMGNPAVFYKKIEG